MTTINNKPVKKSDYVRILVKNKKYKEALRIAKDFRLGISPDDSKMMKRGYEVMVHPRFYQSIGLDIDKIAQQGIDTVLKLYG